MSLTAVLVTGLFAGGVSCAAVQGGLLAGLISRQRADQTPSPAPQGATRSSVNRAGKGTPAVESRSPLGRLGDDLVPVGGFLAGKLVSHTLLGALLGALGGIVQLSVGVRTVLLLAAGALIVAFGLAQLGVPGFRRIVVEPPQSWLRLVRGRARSQSAVAPALLGFATILIPCGVTLSVEALALASGSALTGAATMAVFVVGTSPLFALLGYAARKAATAWRGRLAAATGIVVLAVGLYTVNGGLELAGSPLAASRIAQTLGIAEGPAPVAAETRDGQQTLTITARTGSYTPASIAAHAGVPTTLVIQSDDAQGCVRSFLIPSHDVDEILPTDGETVVELGVLEPGQIPFSCGMGMYTGTITVS